MKLVKQNSESYYKQVKRHLVQRINSGEYSVDSLIPSERELCELFSVSRTTIRKATDELVNEGRLIRIPGRGTYVTRQGNAEHDNCLKTGNILFARCTHSESNDSSTISDDIFYPKVLHGVEQAATGYEYNCMYKTVNEARLEMNPLEQISPSVDGIVCGEIHTERFLQMLISTDLPIVLVSPSVMTTRVDIVAIDNTGGAISAVNHLMATGRRAIAYLGGPSGSIPALLRKRGYSEALESAGLTPNPRHVHSSGWRFEDGYDMARDLMQQKDRPDAIFASSDLIAIGALTASRELGLDVPDDVAIIGFDDIDMAREVKPPLTTVRVDKHALGNVAFELLRQTMSGGRDYALHTILPTKLVKRQTG